MDRFARSLRFCHLEFDKEAIFDCCRSENSRYRLGFLILSDFREMSFCSPCEPRLIQNLHEVGSDEHFSAISNTSYMVSEQGKKCMKFYFRHVIKFKNVGLYSIIIFLFKLPKIVMY